MDYGGYPPKLKEFGTDWVGKLLRYQTDIMGVGSFSARDWGLEVCRGLTSAHLGRGGALWWLCELPTLDLSGCVGITDVSPLANVYNLHLTDCTGVTDVSPLANVHSLNLTGCTGVTDVSPLASVHDLNLTGCTGVTDISALSAVHELYLMGCTGVEDFSMLRAGTFYR